jgi:hypothetical protein
MRRTWLCFLGMSPGDTQNVAGFSQFSPSMRINTPPLPPKKDLAAGLHDTIQPSFPGSNFFFYFFETLHDF